MDEKKVLPKTDDEAAETSSQTEGTVVRHAEDVDDELYRQIENENDWQEYYNRHWWMRKSMW